MPSRDFTSEGLFSSWMMSLHSLAEAGRPIEDSKTFRSPSETSQPAIVVFRGSRRLTSARMRSAVARAGDKLAWEWFGIVNGDALVAIGTLARNPDGGPL
jgi:hypothetical protein